MGYAYPMLRRTLIALVLIPLFALLLQSFPWAMALIALVHAIAQLELCSLIPGLGSRARVTHSIFSTVLLYWLALQLEAQQPGNMLLALLLTIMVYLVLSLRLALHGGDPDAPWLLIRALALITLPMAFLPAIAGHSGSFPWLLLLVGASWAADSAAIFAGKLCGRTPLAPLLSPKKTVEGAIAGVFTSGIVWALALLFYWPMDGKLGLLFSPDGSFPQEPLLQAAVVTVAFALGAVLAMLGILGDLAFSLFKRQAQVKDYSAALPGHGGVLDRMDSLLLLIPLVYCFIHGI